MNTLFTMLASAIKPAESQDVETQRIRRLASHAQAAELKARAAQVEADRCRASIAEVDPVALRNALVAERETAEEAREAVATHAAALSSYEERCRAEVRQAEEAAAAERTRLFEEALNAYTVKCTGLLAEALHVRALAHAAGAYVPPWGLGELLFDNVGNDAWVNGRQLIWARRG